MLIGLDFETYGSVDLRKHGLDRYVSDPHFRPLIACTYAVDDSNKEVKQCLDFVSDMEWATRALKQTLDGNVVAAHNAGFEAAVLKWLGIDQPAELLFDSAVVARAVGASSALGNAAPQLLGVDKMEEGYDLIRLFSIPGKYQVESQAFDPQVVDAAPFAWDQFKNYCELDAKLSHDIVKMYGERFIPAKEYRYQALTMKMNQVGWPVDVASVEEMQRRYLENMEVALEDFRHNCDAKDLNLNSLPQLKAWCLERGVKASSFDEKHVTSLLTRLRRKLEGGGLDKSKRDGYQDVAEMLTTKVILGGSSLKKLEVILNTVGNDGRLRDQYMHVGAGQTWRTTGRSVQMQNLKRFVDEPRLMETLFDDEGEWTNEDMAVNLRQVFRSCHSKGQLIVGDFSSVESRGLAWLAREDWKLGAYGHHQDLYRILASKILGKGIAAITKADRQLGKVAELSCGYGAGPGAVAEFAKNMGLELSEGEATKLVYDWRDANPRTVAFWKRLDEMLQGLTDDTWVTRGEALQDGYQLRIETMDTPKSLEEQAPHPVKSLCVEVLDASNNVYLRRMFLGCYSNGRNIRYYKPSDRKTGDLWNATFVDPKTKVIRHYEIYGGKLAGILTQSFCRELFFQVLEDVDHWADKRSNLQVIGQFHDEIVLDWQPSASQEAVSLPQAVLILEKIMSDPGAITTFPLAAEVKHDYRYTK